MKNNALNDIKSRESIEAQKQISKADKKSSKKISEGNKGRETKGNKKEVPILSDEAGIHDEIRDSPNVPSNDDGIKQDK